ncbi:MAG: substrate-binding domain-containing protein, partial [Anaerolineaceae bacterium]|nr:substrate-binding domain-containing protein [Anaerolineaceae bacterium]
ETQEEALYVLHLLEEESANNYRNNYSYDLSIVNNNHPYWGDVHQGFEYAAHQLGVTVVKGGVDTWDPQGQAAALEQVITKAPDGIIVPIFDASILPGVEAATKAGIPVVAIEATIEGANVVSYIGLDNYDSGKKTAIKLIEYGGEGGNVVVMGNWGASNTDAKLQGFEDYLAENSTWKVIAKLDDKAVTETAIEQAKTAFNNYNDMTAIVGLDSSSGSGIGAAMEELGKEPGSITAVVHDREVQTLEYIQAGYLNCTLVNKTASMPFLALLILQGITQDGMNDLPLSGDNAAAGVNPVPEVCYNGTVFITSDNVESFMAENMPTIDFDNYK